MDEDELASRQVAGLMVALDLVDHAARDAVEHGHGDLAAAREWLAARLLALPSDDPTIRQWWRASWWPGASWSTCSPRAHAPCTCASCPARQIPRAWTGPSWAT